MASDPVAGPHCGHFHAVRFYEDTHSLARMAAAFAAEGLIVRQPAVIIATPDHVHAITRELQALSFDLDDLRRSATLIVFDAVEVLATFMVDGMPDAGRFEEAMTPVLDSVIAGRSECVVRAYGEMVDVLWKDDRHAAAIRLEMLWNQLAITRRFSLLCGYSMGSFYKDAAFDDICRQHTHMLAPDGSAGRIQASARGIARIH
jgi:hypothetical protein